MTARKALVIPIGEDVRGRLLASATELFACKGYAATTVREIVQAAGVTKPVLYYYFENKEGLYLELMEAPHARFRAMLDESIGGGGSASDKIRALLERGYDLFIAHRDIARVGYAVYFGPPQGAPFFDFDDYQLKLQETVHILVRAGIDDGEFRDGEVEAMTLSIIAIQNLAIQLELCKTHMSQGREGIGRMLDVLFDGMRRRDTDKGKRNRS
jgi:AcrR family transcriptional regulator